MFVEFGRAGRRLVCAAPFLLCSLLIICSLLIGGVASRPVSAAPADDQTDILPASLQPILGERLSFHGWWFSLPVGSGWIEVKELIEINGRRAYHIEAQGHSNELLSSFYPIHDVVHSYLDADTLQPLRFEKHQREGHYRAEEVVTFDYATHLATYHSLLNESTKTIPIPPDVQDLISALYWFRAQPLVPNHTTTLNLYTDEKIYQTRVVIGPLTSLELLKRGTFRCVVVEPKASFKGLLVKRGRVWGHITADAARMPILLKMTTPWGPMSAVLDHDSLSKRQAPSVGVP